MVERMNKSTEDIMKKLLENQGDWEDMLPSMLFLVLKKNLKYASRLEMLRKKYVGPYMIRDITPSGNYYLTDRLSHDLKKPLPPNHLICFNGKGNFSGSGSDGENSESSLEDCTGDKIIDSAKLVDGKEMRCDTLFLSSQENHGIDQIDVYSGDDNKSTSSEDKDINSSESEENHKGFNENDPCDSDSTMSGACQRIPEYNGMMKKGKCNKNLIKSQFVIMSSHNDLLSSDESVISVGNYVNPFDGIKVDDIPMEIVDDLHTEDDSVRVCLSKVVKPTVKVFFWLLQHLERILTGSRFYRKIHSDDRNVMFNGVGQEFVRCPVCTVTASGDGSCLFNSISLFLTEKEY